MIHLFVVLSSLSYVAALGSAINWRDPLSKRFASSCLGSPGTTPNGLTFELYCNTDIPGNDFEPSVGLVRSSLEECMGSCSTARPRCYGVTYNFNTGRCYFKTNTVIGATTFRQSTNDHSALVTPALQLDNTNTAGPSSDQSTSITDNGMVFRISCGKDVTGGDYCPPSSNSSTCPWHASSLTDCMNQCSLSHPLCTGVSYNPDMLMGYANCYPKNNFAKAGFSVNSGWVTHSAVAENANLPMKCTDKDTIMAGKDQNFTLQCNQNRAGNDISIYHETSLQKCVETCATYSAGGNTCLGIVFDASLELGWENCYLKGAVGTPLYNTTAAFALMTGVKDTSSSNDKSHGSGGGGGGGSKAWIAGVVIGVLAITIFIAAFIFWRRRQHTGKSAVINGQEKPFLGNAPLVEAGYQDHCANTSTPRETIAKEPVELANTQMIAELGSRRGSSLVNR
ncbi:hypothetical protein EJ08DRAFT_608515 [Tothia fuscella]|uniref:Apple domain-containing protein n=1 Tax=Tothia fuscella TaxID=1048955 RepID=A0A9P4NWZ5_9PEZI|nr:hypothetical protein EJ08DRAFT_608515 [Tothia fuscella]